jgi:hypothetical protein
MNPVEQSATTTTQAAEPDPFEPIIARLEQYARAQKNCLLIGESGIGKTSLVLETARKLGLRLTYFSAPTLDPWADLIGVPVPREERLAFLRPEQVQQAEFLFLDELNRAHPRVQNAVLELTLFKSLNGEPLPRLRMVWAAINPPTGDYALYELERVLKDRFPFHLQLPYCPSPRFFQDRFPETVARPLLEWWQRELSAEQQKAITPRRLQQIGDAHCQGLPLNNLVPFGEEIPLHLLIRRLHAGNQIQFEDLLRDPRRFQSAVRADLDFATRFLHLLTTCSHEELHALRELVLALPPELLMSLKRPHANPDPKLTNPYPRLLKAITMNDGKGRAAAYDREVEALLGGPR